MSNTNVRGGETGIEGIDRRSPRRRRQPASSFPAGFLALCCSLLVVAGCRQDMQDQPRYEAYEPSTYFDDGQSSRGFVDGTVPRGYGKNGGGATNLTPGADGGGAGGAATGAPVPGDRGATGGVPSGAGNQQMGMGSQLTGDVNVRGNVAGGIPAGTGGGGGAAAPPPGMTSAAAGGGAGTEIPTGPDNFPFAIGEAELNRGQERFNAFCSMCHGMTGEGDGMVVRRGFRRPPSFHEARLQPGVAAADHFFNVITNGWGAMGSYAYMVPEEDRWKIIAYIRALQLSQRGTIDDIPEGERARLGGGGGSQPPGQGQQGGQQR